MIAHAGTMRPHNQSTCEKTRSTGADVAGQQKTLLNSLLRSRKRSELMRTTSERSPGIDVFISCRYSFHMRNVNLLGHGLVMLVIYRNRNQEVQVRLSVLE